MHLRREARVALATVVMLAGAPVLLATAPAHAARAGACTIVGTPDDDVLTGTDGDDVICGLGGDDKLVGRGGDDVLRGGGDADVVRGGPGDDRVAGGRGDDRVFGQGGDDVVRGDAGDDEVVGGPGDDRLGGFRGADEMKGDGDASGFVDDVRCGPGPDTASADPADRVRHDCETVTQNDPPTDLTLVPSTIAENEPIGTDVGKLTAVDADPGDSHTFSLVPGAGSADNALVRVDGDSLESAVRFDFEADNAFSVRVRATDDAGEFTEKAFTVTVTDANDAPVAVDDDAAGTEDTQLDLPVSGAGSPAVNDTDQDGDPLTVSAVSSPTGGTVSISAGQIHFVPTANLCGIDAASFVYTVSDGSGGTDAGIVTVDLTCVNDLPVAVDDDKSVAEDVASTALTVLSNDTDQENDPITVTGASDPANGSTTFSGADVSYAPDADYCNTPPPYDTFTYTVNGGDTATVRVTVTCVNDAPTAVDDDRTTAEDTALQDPVTGAGSPAANDTDVDGDTLTVTAVTNPTGGTVAIATGQITFTPTANLCGPNTGSYDYTVDDGHSGTDTGTVTIDITCVNDPPFANDDARTVAEDSGATVFATLRGNDTDVESDPITITGASDPAHGATSFTAADVTYTPDPDYCGADSFTYTVNGGDTATVSVTVTCVNDAPVANDDSETVTEDDAAAAVDVLGNDTDVESDPITIASASDPANGTVVLTGGTAGAHTGLTYEPDADYCNDPPGTTPDTFTYTVNVGDTATVSVTVTCVDDDPTAVDDTATVTLNDPATAVDVLGNDTDVDGGPKSIASASDPANGTVVITGGGTGLTYEPDTGYCNTDPVGLADTFTYTLSPGGDSATVSMTVTCDVPPVAVDDTVTVAEDASATAVDVLANDTNPDGGPKVVTGASDPAHGATTFTAAGVNYTPDPDYCGADSFTYTVNGGDSATVSVTVTCVNDPPVANDDSRTVAEDSGATAFGTLLGNDTDVESDPITITGASDPAHGSTTFTAADVTYTPDANYCGADSFTYTVNGGDTATVSVTVTCVPDAPTLDNSAGTTTYTEDATPVVVDSGVTISNPDGLAITAGGVTLTADVAGDVLDWTDNDLGDSITEGTSTALVVDLTGTGTAAEWEAALEAVTFATPSQNPSAADRTATFTVTTSAGSPTDTKLVDAANVDDPPLAVADAATVLEDAAATAVTVLTNDTDVDAGPMTITAVSNPANGTTAITGGGTGLTYAPDLNYCNDPGAAPDDTFTYTLNTGGAPQTATVSMTVTCVNDAPVADAETFNGAKRAIGNTSLVVDDPTDGAPDPAGVQKTVSGDILDGDTDVDTPLANLTVQAETKATTGGGSVTIQADGDFTYLGQNGCDDTTDSFTYTLQDNDPTDPKTGTGTVNLTSADCVWYVDSAVASEPAAGVGGTSQTPFKTFLRLSGPGGGGDPDEPGDWTFVAAGTYPGGYAVEASQQLLSTRHGLAVPDGGSGTTVVAAPDGGAGSATISGGFFLSTNNTVQGMDFGNNSVGFSVNGTSVGTATINTVTSGEINNTTGGGGLRIIGAGNTVTAKFSTLSSTGGTNGILLNDVSGSIEANAGSLTGATSTLVSITGGSANITYGGTIAKDSGQLVSVASTTGGTKDFNGAISDGPTAGDGGGVSLTNNSGATVRFDGGLSLSTGTTAALTATGGGTVVATQDNSAVVNTLATTSATALNVANTTIGAAGLTFRSIASSGAANGIVLNNTGASGGLTVSGNGGTCTSAAAAGCTGGVIQNSGGAGIDLTNVGSGVSLTRVSVNGGGDDGIRATTVGDLDLADSVVINNGNNHTGGAEERGLDYLNVTGTPQVLRTIVSGSDDSNAHIRNTSSGTATWTVDNSTFSDSKFNAGLRFRGEGSSTLNATVTNSTFSLNADPGFSVQTDASNTAHQTVLFDNNNVSGGSSNAVSGRPQISINTDSAAVGKVTISNNHIKSAAGAEIIINTLASQTASGSLDARVIGNTINDAQAGALDALSDGGTSIWGWAHGDGATRIEVRNNTVANWGGRALELSHNDGNGTADFTVTGNTFTTPDVSPNTFEGMYILTGGAGGDASNVCVDLENNDFDGIGRQAASDLAIDRFTGTQLRFADFNDTSTANLQNNLRGKNPASSLLTVQTFSNGPTATAATSCTLTSGTP